MVVSRFDPEAVASIVASTDSDQQHYLLNPPVSVLRSLVPASATDDGDLPPLGVLARKNTLYDVRQQFPLASRLQELIEEGQVALRKSPIDQNTTVLVSESELIAFVVIEETVEWLTMDESKDSAGLFGELEELWDDSEQYSLRTPPLTVTLDSATETLGESFGDRFTRAVEWAEELADPTEFHAIRAAVVIGAAEEHLHYEVSKWGEDASVASKASFSRHKGDLEDRGLVRTEKAQVLMGRPRQRLFLTDEYRDLLAEEGLDALLAAATE
jgi:hypothetical protein